MMEPRMEKLQYAIREYCWREYREEMDFRTLDHLPVAYLGENGCVTRIWIDIRDLDRTIWLCSMVDADGVVKDIVREDTAEHMAFVFRNSNLDQMIERFSKEEPTPPQPSMADLLDERREVIIARLVDNAHADDPAMEAYMADDLHEDDNLLAAVSLMAEAELTEQHIGSMTYSPEFSQRLFAGLDYERLCVAVQRVVRMETVRNQRLYLLKALYNARTLLVRHGVA